ncbi:MAG: hypothetical protein ABH874_05830 [Methanobacteriota archaeon]
MLKALTQANLEGKDDYIKEILKKGVSKSLIEKYSKVAKMVKGRTEILRPNESNVRKVINNWKPRDLYGHEQFKKDLFLLLQKKFGKGVVKKESGDENPDIIVSDKIPIELKFNFALADCDRAKGQLDRYVNRYKENVQFVVCGIKEYDNGWAQFQSWLDRNRKIKNRVNVIKIIKSEIRK